MDYFKNTLAVYHPNLISPMLNMTKIANNVLKLQQEFKIVKLESKKLHVKL